MTTTIRRLRTAALPILLAAVLSGCVFSRSEIDVPTPVVTPRSDGVAFVKITEIRDLRHFEASPSDAGTPSLTNASEITDKSVTSRAVGRKRDGFGMSHGDYLLPPGKTVAGLVRAATEKALQSKGYTVVEASSPQYAAAVPLSVEIVEFWSWIAPGFPTPRESFKAMVKLASDPLVGPNPEPAWSQMTETFSMVLDSEWSKFVGRGVDDLSERIEDRLKAPRRASP